MTPVWNNAPRRNQINVHKGLVAESIFALTAVIVALLQRTPLAFGSARLADFLNGFAAGLSLVALVGWLLYAFLGRSGGPVE